MPAGPLFALVSCPNYTAEVLSWVGFSIMTQVRCSWRRSLVCLCRAAAAAHELLWPASFLLSLGAPCLLACRSLAALALLSLPYSLARCLSVACRVACRLSPKLLLQIGFAYLFTLVGFAQMSEWALAKHRNYIKNDPEYKRLGRKAIVPFLL